MCPLCLPAQLNLQSYMSKQIQVGTPQKGVLLQDTLTDLKIPLSYEVRLTPITNFGPGDTAMRIIQYIEHQMCSFEVEKICGFTQDKKDDFDWTWQNANTQNPKRSPNTGPINDRSGTREGYYMYIEASRPRVLGDKACLVSPLYNVTTKAKGPYKTPFCISFYYHMYGKHIELFPECIDTRLVGLESRTQNRVGLESRFFVTQTRVMAAKASDSTSCDLDSDSNIWAP
ncbi:UNVERIFIED_CONTAM: hypothetical protein FKN15_035340 [Acipenser sinensis]